MEFESSDPLPILEKDTASGFSYTPATFHTDMAVFPDSPVNPTVEQVQSIQRGLSTTMTTPHSLTSATPSLLDTPISKVSSPTVTSPTIAHISAPTSAPTPAPTSAPASAPSSTLDEALHAPWSATLKCHVLHDFTGTSVGPTVTIPDTPLEVFSLFYTPDLVLRSPIHMPKKP